MSSVLLVDGFRADKCFGDKKTSITPNIDSLIQNGILYIQRLAHKDAFGFEEEIETYWKLNDKNKNK